MRPRVLRKMLENKHAAFSVSTESLRKVVQMENEPSLHSPFISNHYFRWEEPKHFFFDKRLGPIGRARIDMVTGKYVDTDAAGESIMGGNVIGMFPAAITRNPAIFWTNIVHVAPTLMDKGEIVFQSLSYRLNGAPIVIRMLYKREGDFILTTFQDVSVRYSK